MCGRFAFYSPGEAVARLFALDAVPEIEPRYNIAPTQPVASVRVVDGQRALAMLHWGLVPSWAKERSIGSRLINARSETVAEKPSFRSAWRHRRCLVLASGYYEWQRRGAVKQPYFISFADGRPFGMAGLWERWRDPVTGQDLESCCILTTVPAPTLAEVHDRMPVIIPPEHHATWLDAGQTAQDSLAQLLLPCADPALLVRPVSRRVNDARNQGAGLVEQVSRPDDAE